MKFELCSRTPSRGKRLEDPRGHEESWWKDSFGLSVTFLILRCCASPNEGWKVWGRGGHSGTLEGEGQVWFGLVSLKRRHLGRTCLERSGMRGLAPPQWSGGPPAGPDTARTNKTLMARIGRLLHCWWWPPTYMWRWSPLDGIYLHGWGSSWPKVIAEWAKDGGIESVFGMYYMLLCWYSNVFMCVLLWWRLIVWYLQVWYLVARWWDGI